MQLGYIIIYVSNVEKSLEFYKQTFQLNEIFLHECKQYGEINTGTTKLAFVDEQFAQEHNNLRFTLNRINATSAGVEIAFVTSNVYKSYDHAIAYGAIPVKSPTEQPWGQIVAYVQDLNGILVELCSPLS